MITHAIASRVNQFNNLIDLEADYGTSGRKIVDAYEQNTKINGELAQYMHEKIEEHDRNSLVKKMPKMLTTRPLPDVLQKLRNGRKV